MSNIEIAAMSPLPPLYPPQDDDEFMSYKPAARSRAWSLYQAACIAWAAPKKQRVSTIKEIAKARGKCFNAIYEPVKAYLLSKDWRSLMDRRPHSELWHRSGMDISYPAPFLQFWQGMVQDNQRCVKTAYRLLMIRLAAWRQGDMTQRIDGYSTPPANAPGKRHPHKWSYRDLLRVKSSDIEIEAMRHGKVAAKKLLAPIYTSRIGGYPQQEIQFDDRWIDIDCVYGDNKTLSRVLEFACIDWYSGYHFSPWLRPRLNIDGVNKSLSEKDFRLYAVHFAATVGWSPRGTIYRGERGLCAFRAGLNEKLSRHSNRLISIAEPGMSGSPAYVGGFAELAKGNPDAKALKEGMGKLLHNLAAGLIGQAGMNPADKPASHAGREAETRTLLALQGLVDRPLQLAHLTFEQIAMCLFKVYDIANDRIDHQIEGWLEEQLVIEELCVDPSADIWVPITNLPDERRALFDLIARATPGLTRPRRMSPTEVIKPHLPSSGRLTPAAIADCIFEDVKQKVTIKQQQAEFSDLDNYGPGKFRYPAKFQGTDGFPKTLPNGEELWLVVHPAMPNTGHYFTPDGRYLGRVARDHSITRHDSEAVHRAIGKKAKLFNEATLALQVRGGLKRERDLTDNTRIMLDALEQNVLEKHGLAQPATSSPEFDMDAEYSASDLTPQPANIAEDSYDLV